MRAAITPRLLTKAQAAAYCGLSVSAFEGVVTVQPISLGPDPRLNRYDVKALDEWIDRKNQTAPLSAEDYWIERMANAEAVRNGSRRARR